MGEIQDDGKALIIHLPDGKQLKLTVLGIKGNPVRIGTKAPDDISIVREELLEKAETCHNLTWISSTRPE